MHISVSNFCNNIQTNYMHMLQPPQNSLLGKARRILFLHFFFAGTFWAENLQIRYEILGAKFTKKITDLDSLRKIPKLKKNRPNRSMEEGNITDLKSAMLVEFFPTTTGSPISFCSFCAEFQKNDCRFELLLKNHSI